MFSKFKFDSRLVKHIDFKILFSTIMIVLCGIMCIYLAVGRKAAMLQTLWLVVSLVCLYFLLLIDYDLLINYVDIFYWATIVLLVLTDFFIGTKVNGATGWIKIGPVSLQASEFAKVTIILMLAKKIQDFDGNVNNIKNLVIIGIYVAIPMFLLVVQPDMGMIMVFFFITLGIVFCSGINIKTLIYGLSALTVMIVALWNSGLLIKDYQKRRLIAFLNPESNASGDGLQVTRSLIGVGSGGVFGKGIQSPQYADTFVPENHTDMIFSVLAQHFGMVGCIILLVLFGILIYRTIKIAETSKDIFGKVIASGVASYFLFAILQNIGMNIAIMPVTGITLPLVSYGGSSLLTTVLSVGLVINIGMRRKKINF